MNEREKRSRRTHEYRRAKGLGTLLEVSRSLVSTLDLATVLQATTDGAARLAGLETAAIYLTEAGTARLWATTPPLPSDFPDALRVASLADHPHLRDVVDSRQIRVVPDLAKAKLTPAERSVMEQRGLRSVVFLPLVADVRSLGALIVGSIGRPRTIAEPELGLSRTLANLAALAVENARLYAASRRQAAELESALRARERAEHERLRMERQLLQAQKLESLGILAGGIAHDFNNLLVAVVGHADLALAHLSTGQPAAVQHVEEIRTAVQRARELTNQMLAYSGKGRFQVRRLQLGEVVQEMGQLLRAAIPKKVQLRYELAVEPSSIDVDAAQIRQVIMNLVTNAAEAIGDGTGVITLAVRRQRVDESCLRRTAGSEALPAGEYLLMEVTDTGVGMDAATRERIFEPFFTTKFQGRGLGLAAVLGIVRGHDGAISVHSEPGKGSSFRVLLPAAMGEQPAQAPSPKAAVTAAPLSGTVLVVDDEQVVREAAGMMLEHLGFDVLLATDGEAALEAFRLQAREIRLVLLDMTMPRMDGEETFRELRRLSPSARVILASGYDEMDATHRFVGRGLAGFIQKPFTLGELEAKVRESLA